MPRPRTVRIKNPRLWKPGDKLKTVSAVPVTLVAEVYNGYAWIVFDGSSQPMTYQAHLLEWVSRPTKKGEIE